jgi:hypothetical protein
MLSLHPFLWVILIFVPILLSAGLWATSPPEWRWPHHRALCLRYLALCALLPILSSLWWPGSLLSFQLVPCLHYISGDSRSEKPTHTTRPQSLTLQEPLIALYGNVPLWSLFLLACSLYPTLTTPLFSIWPSRDYCKNGDPFYGGCPFWYCHIHLAHNGRSTFYA